MKIPGSISSQPRLACQQCFGSQLCKRSFRSLSPFPGWRELPPTNRNPAEVPPQSRYAVMSSLATTILGSWREGVALRKLQLKIVSSGLQTTARTQLRNELV